MVMVQDEASAKFSGMPDSAASTGLADFVLPPQEMALRLVRFVRNPILVPADPAGQPRLVQTTIEKILSLVRIESGIDFVDYKQSMVERRIRRRIGIAQLSDSDSYLEFLESSPAEVAVLCRDLLISVTRFFRDSEVFANLRENIIPAIMERESGRKTLRIWTPGCATGEEAYSIAILFQEIADRRGERWDIKLFAMRWPPFSGHNPVCVSYDGVGEK